MSKDLVLNLLITECIKTAVVSALRLGYNRAAIRESIELGFIDGCVEWSFIKEEEGLLKGQSLQ